MTSNRLRSEKRSPFRGYLISPKVEIAVTAVFAALAGISRLFQIPLFPPLIVLDLAGAFAYIPASLVSFPLVAVFILVNTVTAPNPFLAVASWILSIPLVNVVSKLSRRYAMWAPIVGPYTGIATFVMVLNAVGALPPAISVPTLLVRATANMTAIILLSPIVWKAFERMGLMQRD